MVPLMLDLTGKLVVVFGGGEVGARKARYFDGEARITVVSRTFHEAFDTLNVERVIKDLSSIDEYSLSVLIERSSLVIAATSDQGLNKRIGILCNNKGTLFNCANCKGDVVMPSIIKGKEYLIAVSTYGKSPAMSKYLREGITYYLSPDAMIRLQNRLRNVLKEKTGSQEGRSEILGNVMKDKEIWEMLRTDEDTALRIALERYSR